jgi:hydrogenase expression/formation protein HypE
MEEKEKQNISLQCPIPIKDYDKILLAHGGGGRLTFDLIQKIILPYLKNEILEPLHDGAVIKIGDQKIAFTTDAYVIQPIFFPGGDIGDLAVNGTVNDLAMCGAKPLYISLSLIIEEGFEIENLQKIISSIKSASEKAGVQVVTGDTKVVERGKGDKIFINTSGIGIVYENVNISSKNCKLGDKIILSGSIAEHGIAILSAREGLEFETTIKSDTAPLNKLVEKIFSFTKNIHMMRDPTRGGISSALNEIAESAKIGIEIDETKLLIKEEVKGACELLGFDPLYVANEGKMLVFVPEDEASAVLEIMRAYPLGIEAEIIGTVTSNHQGTVLMKTTIGSKRIVDMLSGEQLPRIC